MQCTRALIVRAPWAGHIVSGRKTSEIRKKPTKVRGVIGIIEQGSKTVIGTVRLVGSCRVPVADLLAPEACQQHLAGDFLVKYLGEATHGHAWTLADAIKFDTPVAYVPQRGQITWVLVG